MKASRSGWKDVLVPVEATEAVAGSGGQSGRSLIKIKVSISKSSFTFDWDINCNYPLPSTHAVLSLMPPAEARMMEGFRHSMLQSFVGHAARTKIRPRDMAAYIAKAIALDLRREADVSYETLAMQDGGFLSLGNAIFRLEAVDYVNTSQKALPILRKKVIEETQRQGEHILLNAKQKAADILRVAEIARTNINIAAQKTRREIEDLRNEAGRMPPAWAVNLPLYYRSIPYELNRTLFVGFLLDVKLKWFTWKTTTGETLPSGDHTYVTKKIAGKARVPAVPIIVWLPINPSIIDNHISFRQAHVNALFTPGGHLPHITDTHACQDTGDGPPALDNLENYNRAKQCLQRLTEEFNMDSPLGHYNRWHPGIKAFVPEPLKQRLETWSSGSGINTAGLEGDTVEDGREPMTFHAKSTNRPPTLNPDEDI